MITSRGSSSGVSLRTFPTDPCPLLSRSPMAPKQWPR
ncbi:hypothetical protein E2C01_082543 [Portunus trituberculatus]|uniref:Uncharacterized protein n=1 Tax=Portunus trituberculatus TaxID=210409 RepID=A0A5B7ISM3_PORTR|nr:hypothetical protein [Portunus trituberculatus]